LVVDMPCSWEGAFPRKEGGIRVLAGLAPCSSQTVGSLLVTSKAGQKNAKLYINDIRFGNCFPAQKMFANFTIR
jgi:hypothetical protein